MNKRINLLVTTGLAATLGFSVIAPGFASASESDTKTEAVNVMADSSVDLGDFQYDFSYDFEKAQALEDYIKEEALFKKRWTQLLL